jgi:hypothetical protein
VGPEPTDREPLRDRIRWGNVAWTGAALAAAGLVTAWPRLASRPPELPPPAAATTPRGAPPAAPPPGALTATAAEPAGPLVADDVVAAEAGAVAKAARDGAKRARMPQRVVKPRRAVKRERVGKPRRVGKPMRAGKRRQAPTRRPRHTSPPAPVPHVLAPSGGAGSTPAPAAGDEFAPG